MLERFITVHHNIERALNDLNLGHLLNTDDLITRKEILNVMQPIKLAVEALSRRDVNLLTSEGILKTLFDALKTQDSEIAKKMLTSLKIRIERRRNNNLVSVIKLLLNPQTIKSGGSIDSKDDFFKCHRKTKSLKLQKNMPQKFWILNQLSLPSKRIHHWS